MARVATKLITIGFDGVGRIVSDYNTGSLRELSKSSKNSIDRALADIGVLLGLNIQYSFEYLDDQTWVDARDLFMFNLRYYNYANGIRGQSFFNKLGVNPVSVHSMFHRMSKRGIKWPDFNKESHPCSLDYLPEFEPYLKAVSSLSWTEVRSRFEKDFIGYSHMKSNSNVKAMAESLEMSYPAALKIYHWHFGKKSK